jgi:hypothetical protein
MLKFIFKKQIMPLIIYDTDFTHDWNTREGEKIGKLNCQHFTTLRNYSAKYAQGTIHRIVNNHSKKKREMTGYTVVIRQMSFKMKDIEKYDVLCRLDTGYGWQETKAMLQKIYPKNTDDSTMCFALMRYLTKLEIGRMNEKIAADSQTTIL